MLRTIAFIALSAVSLCAGAARADDKPTADERKRVTSCVEREIKAGKNALNCIGVVADPCAKAVAQKHPDEAKPCARKELAIWSDRLKSLMAGGEHMSFPENKRALQAGDKPWLAARESLCPIFDKIEPGFAPGGADYCRMLETGRRVVMIEWIKAATSEH